MMSDTRMRSMTARTSTPAPSRPGRVRPVILLWALGVPIPIILLILLVRGCMG